MPFKPSLTTKRAQKKRKLKVILVAIIASSIMLEPHLPRFYFGAKAERALSNPAYGRGKGAPGHSRKRKKDRLRSQATLSWLRLKQWDDSIRLQQLIHLSVSEFETMLADMEIDGLEIELGMDVL